MLSADSNDLCSARASSASVGTRSPDEAKRMMVRAIFERYERGVGAKTLARELNERGLTYRGRPWKLDLVLRVLDERAVIGKYEWGETDTRCRRRAARALLTRRREQEEETRLESTRASRSCSPSAAALNIQFFPAIGGGRGGGK